MLKHFVEHGSGLSDEGLTALVFVVARRFAHDCDLGGRRADPKHRVRSTLAKPTTLAGQDLFPQRLKPRLALDGVRVGGPCAR
jgi:hypothetical protein